VIWEGSQADVGRQTLVARRWSPDGGRQKVVTDAGHLALVVWPWLLTVVA